MSPIQAIFSIPVLPLGRPHGWWSNRRSPNSRWLSPNDVVLNVTDSWHGFSNRLPENAWLQRDRQNNYNGSAYQQQQRRENSTNNSIHSNNPFGP